MTQAVKAKVMFAVLCCAPMGRSKAQFQKLADAADVDGLWSYYQNAMSRRPDIRHGVESASQVSFEMLRPAMEALYRLATT